MAATLIALSLVSTSWIGPAPCQEAAAAEFAEPRKLHAGGALAGHGRLYPSPVMHDVDGDGRADLLIADLFGNVTWAKASANEPGRFEAEQKLKMRDGEPLKFSNW